MRASAAACMEVLVHRQWLVTLRDLPDAGREWDAAVARALLANPDEGAVEALVGLCDDVHWQLALARKGDVYRLTGRWQAQIERQCSRCNAAFVWHVEGETERDFRLAGRPHEANAEESECELVESPGEIDLLDILREDIWLAWKADVVCHEDCKGLCVQCGQDLNQGACGCDQEDPTHPFAALRKLKLGA